MIDEKWFTEIYNEMCKKVDESFELKTKLTLMEKELDSYKQQLNQAELNLQEAKQNYEFLKTINIHLKEDIAEYKRRLDACGYQE